MRARTRSTIELPALGAVRTRWRTEASGLDRRTRFRRRRCGSSGCRGRATRPTYGSALYGHGVGGVVTTVSRSGGATLHGMGFYTVRDSAWAAVNPFSVASTYADGVVTSALVKPLGPAAAVWRARGRAAAGTLGGQWRRNGRSFAVVLLLCVRRTAAELSRDLLAGLCGVLCADGDPGGVAGEPRRVAGADDDGAELSGQPDRNSCAEG